MATTGQSVDARKARDWGLVLNIVDATLEQQGQLGVLGEALVLAQQVCLAQEGAVRKVKAVMVQTADNDADCAMMVEREAFGSRMGSGEVQFGMEALIRARNASSVSP
jgi:enoyl-CoA hydratase/carnithine racemase